MTIPADVESPESSAERWQASLALLLVMGLLIAIVGESISAAGAPEIGVVDEWGRIDEAVSQIASWQYLFVAIAALFLLGGFGVRRADLGGAWTQRLAWFGLAGELAAFAVAAAVGIVALFKRVADGGPIGGAGFPEYYSDTERIGESVGYVAILIVAAGVLAFVIHRMRAKDPAPDS